MNNKHIYETPWIEVDDMLVKDIIVMSGEGDIFDIGDDFGDNDWE